MDLASAAIEGEGFSEAVASFFNVPQVEVSSAIRGGLIGETDGLKRFGVFIPVGVDVTGRSELIRRGFAVALEAERSDS